MLLLGLLLACGAPRDPDLPTGDGGGSETGTPPTGRGCPVTATVAQVGTVGDAELVEASGLVVSRTRPGLLWSHNDSGGGTDLYALDATGAPAARVDVDEATATDWEDLATGPWQGGQGLFVGDIGDNAQARVEVVAWALPEPEEGQEDVDATGLRLRYPDGAHDAEALLVDPLSGDLLIVTKTLSTSAGVYLARAPLAAENDLVHVADLDLSADQGVVFGVVTGGATSPDGTCLYLRTYGDVLAWSRDPSRPVEEAFAGQMTVLPSRAEDQGEAIAADEDGYWTVSEGKGAPLYRFTGAW
ncbi:hypothetical protein L6R53_22045 [Myxococcota bacterium]|nr:hypothetical protein [Myxococcota bacterium]